MPSPQRLVLLHGFTQKGAAWSPIVERLRKVDERFGGWDVLAPDLPGHDGAPIADGDTLESAADRLAESYGPAHYVGYSLGGRLLLHLAIKHPHLVKSMVLVGAKAGYADVAEAAARVKSDERLAQRLEALPGKQAFRDWLTDEWLAAPMFHGLRLDEEQLGLRLGNDPSGLAASLRHHGSGRQRDLKLRLSGLTMPTLVIYGAFDPPTIKQDGDEIARAFVSASSVVMDGAGHASPWETPDRFVRALADFLRTAPD